MKHFLLALFYIIFFASRPCDGNVLTSINGDRYIGRLSTLNLIMHAPYGLVYLPVDRVYTLTAMEERMGFFIIKSVNRDQFTGVLGRERLEFKQETGPAVSFQPSEIQAIRRDRYGRTYPIQTTLFFMKNGDHFSGELSTHMIAIQTPTGERRVSRKDLLRIDFTGESGEDARIFLKNGGLFQGKLLTERLVIAPDIHHPLTICIRHFQTIQFNARKLIRLQGAPPIDPLPDADADGVPDNADQCPDTPCSVIASADGCPMDSDKDGVVDAEDVCPNTPRTAPVDKDGCWRPAPILFNFNQDEIKPRHRPTLYTVARVMHQNPGLKIEIHGHTDSIGAEAYNQGLSMRRARAAAEVLMDKGIAGDRIETQGFGFARPAAPNETEAGRSMNRRAEIRIDTIEKH